MLKNLYVITGTTQPADGTLTVTIRKNGADTNISIVIPAGATSGVFSNTSNTTSVSAGDLLTLKFVNASASSSASVAASSFIITEQGGVIGGGQ